MTWVIHVTTRVKEIAMSIGFMSDVRLTSAKEAFIFDYRVAEMSCKTLRTYHDVLTKFLEFTGDITVQALKPDHVRMYIAYLADQLGRYKANLGRSVAHTLSQHYAVIRTWIRWLYAQKLITERSSFVTAPRLRDLFPARSLTSY
jgi:site-specific recombinase XerD